jgi:hypothetical protein
MRREGVTVESLGACAAFWWSKKREEITRASAVHESPVAMPSIVNQPSIKVLKRSG